MTTEKEKKHEFKRTKKIISKMNFNNFVPA